MSYVTHDYVSGQILDADSLNEMDGQISRNADQLKDLADQAVEHPVDIVPAGMDQTHSWAMNMSTHALTKIANTNYYGSDPIDISTFKAGTQVKVNASLVSNNGVYIADINYVVLAWINGSNCQDYGYPASATPKQVALTVPANAHWIVTDIRSTQYTGLQQCTVRGIQMGRIDNLEADMQIVRRSELGYYAYAAENILCMGDTLTAGYMPSSSSFVPPQSQRTAYPYILGRMLRANVVNAGKTGIGIQAYYDAWFDHYDYDTFDCIILWFGSAGMYDDLDTPGTESNAYCHMIEQIKLRSPNALIVLLNEFATGGDLQATNDAINKIAAKYGLPVVDVSDLSQQSRPELHKGANNRHMGKAGYVYLAHRIITGVSEWLNEDPLRCEFGY